MGERLLTDTQRRDAWIGGAVGVATGTGVAVLLVFGGNAVTIGIAIAIGLVGVILGGYSERSRRRMARRGVAAVDRQVKRDRERLEESVELMADLVHEDGEDRAELQTHMEALRNAEPGQEAIDERRRAAGPEFLRLDRAFQMWAFVTGLLVSILIGIALFFLES